RAGADDDRVRAEIAVGRAEQEAAGRAGLQAGDRDAGAHRQVGRVPLQILDDLVPRGEPLRVVPGVRRAGEVERPVRRDQVEAGPSAAPGLGTTLTLQPHVVNAQLPQFVAHGQAGLPGTDHDEEHAQRSYPAYLCPPWPKANERVSLRAVLVVLGE